MARKPTTRRARVAAFAVELLGTAVLLAGIALVWLPAALVVAGLLAIAVAQRPEDVL